MDASKPEAVEDSQSGSKDDSLSGLACLWDNNPEVRQRMRKKFNLLVHYDPKLQKKLNVKVEKTAHNVRTNAAVLGPVLKIMRLTNGLPAIDKLMVQVADVFGRFSMPITENLANSQSWAIRDMISVLKKNKTKHAWHKDPVTRQLLLDMGVCEEEEGGQLKVVRQKSFKEDSLPFLKPTVEDSQPLPDDEALQPIQNTMAPEDSQPIQDSAPEHSQLVEDSAAPEVSQPVQVVAPEVSQPVQNIVAPEVSQPVQNIVAPEVSEPVQDSVAPEVSQPVQDSAAREVSQPVHDSVAPEVSQPVSELAPEDPSTSQVPFAEAGIAQKLQTWHGILNPNMVVCSSDEETAHLANSSHEGLSAVLGNLLAQLNASPGLGNMVKRGDLGSASMSNDSFKKDEAPQSTAVDETGGPGAALETAVGPSKGDVHENPDEKGGPGDALETAEGNVHKDPGDTSFPEVTQEGYVTRRDQFGMKSSLKGQRGVYSASSKGPVEEGSGLRRMKNHVALGDDDEGQSEDEEPEDGEPEEEQSEHEDEKPRKKPSARGQPKAKATAKAKSALPKSKAKAKAKAKASAKSSAKASKVVAGDGDDPEPPSKKAKTAKSADGEADVPEPANKKAKTANRKEALEAAFKKTFHEYTQLRKPEPLVFHDMNANAALSNPDHIRAVLKYECMKCLIDCYKAGEADKRGKHDHLEKLFAPDGYRYELYWTRFSVGVKRQDGDEYKQIVYFSRPTTCTGTNRVLARYFAWDLDDLPNCLCCFVLFVPSKHRCVRMVAVKSVHQEDTGDIVAAVLNNTLGCDAARHGHPEEMLHGGPKTGDTQQLPPLLAQPVAASTGIQDTQLEQDTFAAAPETAAEDIGVDASQGPDSQTTEPGKEPAADTRADPGPSEQPTVRAANSEPADTGPSKEPTVRAANSEPADTGPSKEPTDTGPNKEPADTGPSKEPADTGPSKEPTDTGPSKEPADTGPNQHSSDTCAGKDWPADNRAGPNKPGAIQPAEAISAHAISSRHTARPNKKPKHPWSLHRRFAVAGKDQGQASPAATSAQAAAPAPAAVAEDEDEEEPEEQDDQIGKVMVTSPDGTIVLTQDALRMRLKRMCEQKKKSHKCHVDNETHEQYASGGPQREWLEMALLEALQDVGTVALGRGKAAHKQVQASFKVRVTQIRERQMLKESETNGEWLTEEKMNKSGEYSKKWKYDNSVTEYFVEISTKQTIKHSELLKRIENMDLGDAQLHWDGDSMNLGCSHFCY
ncbi:PEG3 [Symbiodinium sp. CCMP2592]|nr:PEG3 [Symbiodinium sp. CCMP2592]